MSERRFVRYGGSPAIVPCAAHAERSAVAGIPDSERTGPRHCATAPRGVPEARHTLSPDACAGATCWLVGAGRRPVVMAGQGVGVLPGMVAGIDVDERVVEPRSIGSAALVADGYHARTDGLTSLAVVIGAAGVAAGYPLADPIVGLLVSAVILVVLRQATGQMLGRLMDAVEPDLVEEVERTARGVAGVQDIGRVRLRWVGHALQDVVHDHGRLRPDRVGGTPDRGGSAPSPAPRDPEPDPDAVEGDGLVADEPDDAGGDDHIRRSSTGGDG